MALPSLTDALRSRGLRMTVQRQLVMEAVEKLGHATSEQVHAEVTKTAAGLNLTTVYRTLELLEEIGLVRHTHLIDTATTYHLAADQHIHLVCRNCRTVTEAPTGMLTDLATRLSDERGFTMDVGHVALFGMCGNCCDAGTAAPAGVPNPEV
ncbi:Fur family transcriptional regulator [Cryptosporangium phraense]|uniref:Transcriptional repressor n=1 Tax=Cryptosporangium phraense TaxID=2593070 RepID=A0A545AHE1_9ACTN|nr:Fur family transcriptional regulator [Cryptosporangium phraense]TQS40742.1 transcriptional repressor [Cryptosporangium phraense]